MFLAINFMYIRSILFVSGIEYFVVCTIMDDMIRHVIINAAY